MSTRKLIQRWQHSPDFSENVAAWRTIPSQPAQYADYPGQLPGGLRSRFFAAGITRLYDHQVQTWQAVQKGENVVLTTGTASGKSLAYNLCTLAAMVENPSATALYVFPTKALAQDQFSKLAQILPQPGDPSLEGLSINAVGIYDGDTPASRRQKVRQQTRLLITNPDMLHIGILPHHTRWADFFSGLRFIILDEVHIYRGVFGSHVANVIRRLLRIARFYGANPQFVFTSATIENAGELCAKIASAPVRHIAKNGASAGSREFILFNPPLTNPELGLRRGILQECQFKLDEIEAYGIQALVFVRSRRSVEILVRNLHETASQAASSPEIRGYRSGYLPGKRREIESALRSGKARTVVATNALELGIDIGGLEAVLLAGYPGTIASTWQQAGRAGRSERDHAIVLFILGSNPLDQFLAQHPEYLFEQNPERALINPDHPLILFQHLQCAAFELPFDQDDTYGSLTAVELAEIMTMLSEGGAVHQANNRYFWVSDQFPAGGISLRSASSEKVLIQHDRLTIAEVDLHSAYWMVHPDAIYLQEGQSYLVRDLDLEDRIAVVEPVEYDYYTEAINNLTFKIDLINQHEPVMGGHKYHTDLTVTSQVTGFRRIQWGSHAILSRDSLDMPAVELVTEGYLLRISEDIVSQLRQEGLWQNDPIDYGPNWNTARSLTLARDRSTCQVCGAVGDDLHLHVHHKIPFRTFPSYLEANLLHNLVTLCPACHQRTEQNLRIRSSLAGMGYLLVNLAPFFLMCDRSDLGLHTDPRSPLLDQSPAILLYEQIPAGIGLSREIYQIHSQLIDSAYDLISSCPCSDGCPSCVGPGGENGTGGKNPATALLSSLRQAATLGK